MRIAFGLRVDDDSGLGCVVNVESRQLSLTVLVTNQLKNTGARGLYGNYNGDQSDDLIARDETVLSPAASEREINDKFGLSCTDVTFFVFFPPLFNILNDIYNALSIR